MSEILEDKALPSRCCDWIIEIRSPQDVIATYVLRLGLMGRN
jgi:hypothetical protein